MRDIVTIVAVIVVIIVVNWFSHASPPLWFPFPEDADAVAILREIAISKDTKHLSLVFHYLKHKPGVVRAAAALTLGRLKVREAIPDLEAIIQNDKFARRAAQVALARLKADLEPISPHEKVRLFLSNLGLDLDRLNYSVRVNKSNRALITPYRLELCELADMLVDIKSKGIDTQPIELKIPFEAEYGAILKLHLSAMPQKQRIAFLIRNILTLNPTIERYYDVQALADEGHAAVPSIISALQEIHKEIRKNGFSRRGGAAEKLIDALRCIGDKRALPILQTFEAQPGVFWLPYDPEKGKLNYFIQGAARAAIRDIKEGRRYCVAWF